MEPNNLENQIKEKLNAREIQPSAQTWDRLDAMLTVAEEKKVKRFPFWFIGIAASVLVLLTVGLFFFNQEKNVSIPTNEIVVAPEVKKTTINNEQQIVEENQDATSVNQQSKINNPGVSIINQKNNQSRSVGTFINREKQIEFLLNENVALKDLPKIISTELIIAQPKPQLVAKKTTYVDVDALLASAENSIDKKAKVDKIKVDANSLLTYAETEVETTFREKVINSISKNYQEVKTALATRNQE